jgi:hypothetical protein
MKKEHKKKAFESQLENRLPYRGQDNSGRWFVARKSATGIEVEIMEDEAASQRRMGELLFEPNTEIANP